MVPAILYIAFRNGSRSLQLQTAVENFQDMDYGIDRKTLQYDSSLFLGHNIHLL